MYLLDGETNPIKIELKEESISVPGNKPPPLVIVLRLTGQVWNDPVMRSDNGWCFLHMYLSLSTVMEYQKCQMRSRIFGFPSEVSFVQSDESEPVNNGLHLYFSMNSGLEMKHESSLREEQIIITIIPLKLYY